MDYQIADRARNSLVCKSMSKPPKAVETSTLPQYRESLEFMDRFLIAAHQDGSEIERSKNTKGIKLVDGSELSADALDYFEKEKASLENEFMTDLVAVIGQGKSEWFCNVIANDWFDGRRLRQDHRVLDLKNSIREAIMIAGILPSEVVQNHELVAASMTLSITDIAHILTVNRQMMTRHIEAWKGVHPNAPSISDDGVFFRRGLSLDEPIDTNLPYKEWDYLNSYSLALSAPEKFAQMQTGKRAVIVNGDLELFRGRILFFSPFIPGMNVGQLEAGIIPGSRAEPIRGQGEHGGILEYIIGDQPC